MPYLILKLGPLITVDGLRTAKLGDPGFDELVGDHFGFFAWNRVGDSEFRESVLTGEDIAVALIRFWKRTNEVHIQDFSRVSMSFGVMFCIFKVDALLLGQAVITGLYLLTYVGGHTRPEETRHGPHGGGIDPEVSRRGVCMGPVHDLLEDVISSGYHNTVFLFCDGLPLPVAHHQHTTFIQVK